MIDTEIDKNRVIYLPLNPALANYSPDTKIIFMNEVLLEPRYKQLHDYCLNHEQGHALIDSSKFNTITKYFWQGIFDAMDVLFRNKDDDARITEFLDRHRKPSIQTDVGNLLYRIMVFPLGYILSIKRILYRIA